MIYSKIIVIIGLLFVTAGAKPIQEKDPGRRAIGRQQQNGQFKALGHNWMDPYRRINLSAKINSRNEEKRRHEMTRPTRATSTTIKTTAAAATTTINPQCMPQIVKLEAPSPPFYPPFTSKDWSPGLGK